MGVFFRMYTKECIFQKIRARILLFFGLFPIFLLSQIRETIRIAEVFSEVRPDSIVLMDIDETLVASSIMLGGKAWREHAMGLLKTTYSPQKVQDLRDRITYWIAKRVPCVAVEHTLSHFLNQLKSKQIPVFGFTARGKKYWHTMPCDDGVEMACLHLGQAGLDLDTFCQSQSDAFLAHPSFAKGVFFAQHPFEDKGTLALEIFAQAKPAHILFVDDRLDNVHSAELRYFISAPFSVFN